MAYTDAAARYKTTTLYRLIPGISYIRITPGVSIAKRAQSRIRYRPMRRMLRSGGWGGDDDDIGSIGCRVIVAYSSCFWLSPLLFRITDLFVSSRSPKHHMAVHRSWCGHRWRQRRGATNARRLASANRPFVRRLTEAIGRATTDNYLSSRA